MGRGRVTPTEIDDRWRGGFVSFSCLLGVFEAIVGVLVSQLAKTVAERSAGKGVPFGDISMGLGLGRVGLFGNC